MTDILKVLDAQYVAGLEDRGRTPGVVRASELGNQPRRLAFALMEFKGETPSGRSARVFEVGDLRHDALRAKLADWYTESRIPRTKNAEFALELPLGVEDWRVVGHPDGLIEQPVEVQGVRVEATKERPVLLEIKTVNAFGWKDATAGLIDSKYRVQAAWYALAAGASHRLFLMERKDTQHLAALLLPAAEPLLEQALAWAREAVAIVRRLDMMTSGPADVVGAVAPCTGSDYGWQYGGKAGRAKLGWRCSYCPFAADCFPEHVRIVGDRGKPECIARETVPDGAVVVAWGKNVIPSGKWKIAAGADDES